MNTYNNQYQLIKKLSAGSYGIVYEGETLLNKTPVAIKIEKKEKPQTLEREVAALSKLQSIKGVPSIFWSGNSNGQNILVMQLLSKDLGYYLKQLRKFSLKTVLMIGDSLFKILKNIHSKGIIHRDLKPENIMYHQKQIYIVDFGISKNYRDGNQKHIAFKEGRPFVGTTRYAPIAAHKGQELSRKDDLETLLYILILFLKGALPWQHQVSQTNKDRQRLIGEKKQKLSSSEVCQDLPIEFQKALEQDLHQISHVKCLGYYVEPDYDYLINLFKKLGQRHGIEYDNQFDWCKEEEVIVQTTSLQQSEKIQPFSLKCQSLQVPSTLECMEKKQTSISNIFQTPVQISQSAVIFEIESHSTVSDEHPNALFSNYTKLESFSNLYHNHLMIMKNK